MASSSSPSSTAANRDGSASAAEDEAVMSVTRAIAQDALLQFQSGKFDQCLTALSECLKRKPNDPKISHNIGLAEFYRDGCSDPKRLLDVLDDVKKRSEELARTSAEQVESGSNTGDKVALGSKGSGAMGHSFSAVYMDEFDTYVATLNIAVIWFHLHEYAKALSVVEPLFQNRGPIDEKTALNICLLLLDVGLACHDAMKSAINRGRNLIYQAQDVYFWDMETMKRVTSCITLNLEKSELHDEMYRSPEEPHAETGVAEQSGGSGPHDFDHTPLKYKSIAEVYENCNLCIIEPETFEDAVKDEAWQKAMENEITMIEKNNTWE